MEIILAVPKLVKHRVTIWPINFIPRYVLKRNGKKSAPKTCTQMFTAPLLVEAQK